MPGQNKRLSDDEWNAVFAQVMSDSSSFSPFPARRLGPPDTYPVKVRAARARWLTQCGWPVGDDLTIDPAKKAIWEAVEKVLKHRPKLRGMTQADAMRAVAPRLDEGCAIWRLKGGSMYDWVCAVLNDDGDSDG